MPIPNYVHLRLHSEYSIVDGIVRLEDAIAQAVSDQMGALALTDLMNFFGLIKFYSAARNSGIKPIVGSDVWISHPTEKNKSHRALLLVQNTQGYLNLCELLSKASLETQPLGRHEIHPSWFTLASSSSLAAANPFQLSEGLIFLSGAVQGDIGQALLTGQVDLAERCAQHWQDTFPGRFYIEVQRTGHVQEEQYIYLAAQLASRLNIPLVATHPIQFMQADDFRAHEIRVCVADGDQLGNPKRVVRFSPDQYFKSTQEMLALFADLPSALNNSVEIAQRCNLILQLGQAMLPDFPIPAGLSLEAFLKEQSHTGLAGRLLHLFPELEQRLSITLQYEERLDFEIKTIAQMGFSGYFLIVADFIAWAKNNGVPVGPGRGSGAGSLVAYSLGITDLDPLRYNLLFERFLNPERVSMPDFDIDFCQLGRDRVIQYVKDKYGHAAVSQIATFGTMAAKGAIKDVGRALQQPYGFVDGISKLIVAKPGTQITIREAMQASPDLDSLYQNNEEAKNLIDYALQLEGITRNVGMHAGGVLIAPGQLTDFCPLYSASGRDDQNSGIISQFDKDDVESVGLVKFDFLGLTTLTILDLTQKYIRHLYPQKEQWRLEDIALDDSKAFEVLKTANTVAVFQLESQGMQNMLKEAKPERFEDIIALVALFRPGPMDLIPDYIARKHQKQAVIYPDERVIPILEETYGIMVYQEQVMQMAQIIGGYSLGSADILRRAMGKKKPEEMVVQSQIFAQGAMKNGLTQEKADEIFKNMEAFAGYGFNKSHAAAYAVLAYQTAWLKAHYVAEFMAANLSLAMDDTDKIKILFADAKSNQIEILPPDINSGEFRFLPILSPEDAANGGVRKVLYGLGAVRGTGENAISEIVRVRTEKPFVHIFDFCQRADRRIVNRRAIEALIRAGAFDAINPEGMSGRSTLLASLPNAMQAAEQALVFANQSSLFAMPGELDGSEPEYVCVAPWLEKTRLHEEKAALGFCISGHLFDVYAHEVRHIARTPLNKISPKSGEKLVAGIVVSQRTNKTSNGGVMNKIVIDDGTDHIELIVFEDVFDNYRACFVDDELLIAKVLTKVTPANENFSGSTRHTVQAAMTMASARLQYAKSIHFSMSSTINVQSFKDRMQAYIHEQNTTRQTGKIAEKKHNLPVTAEIKSTQGFCRIQFPADWNLYPDDRTLQGFSNVLHQLGIHSHLEVKYAG